MYLRKNGNNDEKMRSRDDYSEYELVMITITTHSNTINNFHYF